jgi:ADP-ribose pyrophosphatase
MAEGFACDRVAKSPFVPIEVFSAGIESHGMHPITKTVMSELGVDISRQESKTLTPDMLMDLDHVITLCAHADDNCPVLTGDAKKSHWPLDDPAACDGTEEEILAAFRKCRDDIHCRVVDLVDELQCGGITRFRKFTRDDVRVHDPDILYKGFFELHGLKLQHKRFIGDWTDEIYRELFVRKPVVGVLLYDPVRDEVALIEQFRIGALDEPGGPWQLELVAGIAEESESIEAVAQRECMEETGCEPYKLLPMMEYLVSPGGTNEKMHLFCGLASLAEVSGIHGLARESEDIRVSRMPFSTAVLGMRTGRIDNAATIMGIQWLLLNKKLTEKK